MDVLKTTIHGTTSRFVTAGSGTPVLLLHGLGESAIDWQGIFPILASTFRVIAPDFPFTSANRGSALRYGPDFLVRFVFGFLDDLGIERVSLVGHSLGGLVALQAALSSPSRIRTLVLIGSAGLGAEIHPVLSFITIPFHGDFAAAWGKTDIGSIQRIALRIPLLFANPLRAPAWWIREQARLVKRPGFLQFNLALLRAVVDLRGQRMVLLDQLPGLEIPTLILWGKNDSVLPVMHAWNAQSRLPRSQLELIPDCGHLPHVECVDQSGDILFRFLQQKIEGG